MANDWQAALLRVVLFTRQPIPPNFDLYSQFNDGAQPDSQEDRPKEGVRRQTGQIGEAQLRVAFSPILAEIVVDPVPPTAETLFAGHAHTFGSIEIELAKFERRILAWLPKWNFPTTRASLVITARSPAESLVAAYDVLRENLRSVRVQPGEMTDFLFRVNWKAKTKAVDEGYYNRLTTWSAVKFVTSGGTVSGPEVVMSERHFAQLDIDINTPAEHSEPLPPEKLAIIYKEMFALASRITEVGECQ